MSSTHKYGSNSPRTHMTDTLHTIGDWIAATITIATILKLLPAIAALMSILWTLARFYDRWVEKRATAKL